MQLLQQRGAQIDYNDPYFPQLHNMRHYNYENMKSVPLNPQTIGGYDAVVVATDHSSSITPPMLAPLSLLGVRATPAAGRCVTRRGICAGCGLRQNGHRTVP